MTRVTVDLSGIDNLMAREPAKVATWLDGFAEQMVTNIKLSMGTSPAGRTYKRGRRSHVASVAGNPPNPDIGTLRDSINWERDGDLTRNIQDGVEYGIVMEDGSTTVDPRPFMAPEFLLAASAIEADAAANLGLEDAV
jgi:hypothetical protein